jgi:putative effector of murein hydrolase
MKTFNKYWPIIIIGLLVGLLVAMLTSCSVSDTGSYGKAYAKKNGYNPKTFQKHIKQLK